MKISFSNIKEKENTFEQNVNKKEKKLINYFLFYLSMVLSFLSISLYFSLKSFNQEKISHEFSPNINYKNIFNEENNLSNINLRILVAPNVTDTDKEEEKREEEKKKAREKIASNASKMNYAYYVFLIKTFYSLLKMRAYKDEELEDKGKMKVYLYLYISNNGYLFASSVLILLYDFTYEEFKEGYILFYLCGGVFILGTIMAVLIFIKLCKEDQDFINSMYSYDSIKSLYKMPFSSIKNFLLLKDRCCCCGKDQKPYEIQMPKCLCCCNTATLLAKFFTLIVTAIIYYGSLLFLTIILFIVITCLKICGKKRELNLEKENENEKRQEGEELSENIKGEQNLVNNNTDNGLSINQETNVKNPSGYNNY
jgi:hypothetical protein